ncbi:hypothetical protein PHLCEN_2v12148 [Hermanssonia centrifuga]|uniref:histone acetyltransferase n=1 Tax=Hermanssonia centrifuga TaxID=98765 RepID=A0A2R6NI51_9APHY|nr:hypothetical protein PHLCEN_2v12148 [Hermanssonia centrifuga]
MKLRDVLLAALQSLPGTREFHIHVLVASPHKHHGLFPYAQPRPRAYLQDILILLSQQATPDAPRVFVTAVEVSVYNIPATSCGILYVSKVDATGQATAPSPTATLIKSLLTYYTNPETRPIHIDTLWIQVFARSQGQYLFPNSSDHSGKRVLTDVKLCAWWKRNLSEVAAETVARNAGVRMKLCYVLPGLSELEALNTLHFAASTPVPSSVQWTYGHQSSQTDIPLPCPPSKGTYNLGHSIPSFDDDPKSRFIDEIAHTTDGDGIRSPEAKRPKSALQQTNSKDRQGEDVDENKEEPRHQGELNKVTPDEFWERMSFRQECIAGAVTGFFWLGIAYPPPPADSHNSSVPSPLAPQPGQVAPRLLKRVVASLLNGYDFSTVERAVRATETLEGVIRGLCENIGSEPAEAKTDPYHLAPLLFQRETTPEPVRSSAVLEVPRTPKKGSKALPEVSPNPFPEPVASLETYESYIYGSISVGNPPLPPRAGAVLGSNGLSGSGKDTPAGKQVTILTVRKKKRKLEP